MLYLTYPEHIYQETSFAFLQNHSCLKTLNIEIQILQQLFPFRRAERLHFRAERFYGCQ